MKKILFLFAVAFAMLLTACNGCKPEPPVNPEEDAVVITTDDWEDIILKVVPYINKNYSNYAFYEASGIIKKLDKGDVKYGIDHNTFQIAFGCLDAPKSLVGVIENDTLKITLYDEPWLEDLFTTPYIGLSLTEALEKIESNIDKVLEKQPVTYRHELYWKGDYEPKFFAGTISDCHTITAYSFEFDQPLEGVKGFMAKQSGLKSELEKAAK